ncbi:tudor domain-containing protein 1-like isoform X1 [Macrobrachium rosenbergii]|uniref:tudor domain-containing protein 1-like isoform X1 n=1 Tax=Macrobrachium rosenbergii TaxID=79674 RepID=UPI0034D6DEF6
MASSNEKKRCVLEHYFRVVKLNVDKAKIQLDQLMETGVGKAMPLKFLPPKEFTKQYSQVEMFLVELLSMMKSLNEQLEGFMKRYPSETSLLLHGLESEKLLHPWNLPGVEEPSAVYQNTPVQLENLPSTVSESNVLPLYNLNCAMFVTFPEEPTVTSLYLPSTSNCVSAPLNLGVTQNESGFVDNPNHSCSLTASIHAPIPSVIPVSSSAPKSTFADHMSHGCVSPLPLFSTQFDDHNLTEGPTVELYCEAHDSGDMGPVHKEISSDISERMFDDHIMKRDVLSVIQEGKESEVGGNPCVSEVYTCDVSDSLNNFYLRESSSVKVLTVEDDNFEVLSSSDQMVIPDYLLNHCEVSQNKTESSTCGNSVDKSQSNIQQEHNYINSDEKCHSDNTMSDCKFTSGKPEGCFTSVEDKNNHGNALAVEKVSSALSESGLGFVSVEGKCDTGNKSECNQEKSGAEQCEDEMDVQNYIQNEHSYSLTECEDENKRAKNFGCGSQAVDTKTQEFVEKLLVNEPVEVYLSHFKPPDCVWVQLANCKILELQDNLCNILEKEGVAPLEEISVGTMVAARYKVDGVFYRGIITECLNKAQGAKVLFLDYGNLEIVEKADLCMLPDRLKATPAMAYVCILTHFNDIELKTVSGGQAAVLTEIKSCVINAESVKAIFGKLQEDERKDSLLIGCARYSVRVLTENKVLGGKTDVTDQSAKSKEVQKGQSTTKRRRTKFSKLDLTATGNETSGDGKSAGVQWTPLSEEGMKESYVPKSPMPLWSALVKRSISSTVYTIDADRHISKSRKHGHTGFSKHVGDSSTDYTAQAVLSEGSDNSETLIPAYALPSVHLRKTTVPINACTLVPVVLSHVENPHLFYLQILDSETAVLDRFQKSMFDYYKANFDLIKTKELPVGTFWAVRSEDGSWNRAVVLANKVRPSGKIIRSPEVEVRYVDSGCRATVPISRVRVLQEDFTAMQILAIPCSLSEVYPDDKFKKDVWSKASIEAFANKCGGVESTLFAKFYFPSLDETYKVELKTLEGDSINKYLVDSGHAKASSASCFDGVTAKQAVGNVSNNLADEITTTWNPMAAEFLAEENNICIDNECAETVLAGIKNTDERRLCKFFREGKKCPRGETCQWEHARYRDGVTSEREPVFYLSTDNYELPKVGAALATIVTNVVSPSHFYAYFPHGMRDLRELEVDVTSVVDQENLESLEEAMHEHYRYSLPEVSACLPAVGELKVVHCTRDGKEDFYRVRILEIQRETNSTVFKVFFIDYGEFLWVKEEQIRPMVPQFSHLPPQAVECYLEDLIKPEKGWENFATMHLKMMTEKIELVAVVKSIDTMNRLGVNLFNTTGKIDININDVLKEMCAVSN